MESSYFSVAVPPELSGQRLDKALSDLCPDFSRSRLKGLIIEQAVKVDDKIASDPACKVKEDQIIEFVLPPVEDYHLLPENIPLDIPYEDEDLLVVNKAAGMVVHPGAGNWTGTLVHALLYHCGESLSGIGGVMRPGIVHRLDKDTSGLMLVAKNDLAHASLSGQLADRTLSRVYQALVLGVPLPPLGVAEMSLDRHSRDRVKIAVKQQGGKEARTYYRVLEKFSGALSLVECKLETGRTHQIRVHMEALGHPLIGDPLYGAQATKTHAVLKKSGFDKDVIARCLAFPRQALHAKEITFNHPRTGEDMCFDTNLPKDLQDILNILK